MTPTITPYPSSAANTVTSSTTQTPTQPKQPCLSSSSNESINTRRSRPTSYPRHSKRPTPKTSTASTPSYLSNLILTGLTNTTILVLTLDGLKFSTQPTPRRDQTRELADGLGQIYRTATSLHATSSRRDRNTTSPTLKFLFSSPTRSEFIEDLFYGYEIAALPRDLPKVVSADNTRRRERLELEFPGGRSSSGSEGYVS